MFALGTSVRLLCFSGFVFVLDWKTALEVFAHRNPVNQWPLGGDLSLPLRDLQIPSADHERPVSAVASREFGVHGKTRASLLQRASGQG